MTRPDRSIFLEAYALSQSIGQLLRDAMAGGPLTPEEYALYSVVFEAETITPTEVAERLGMAMTTVMEKVRLLGSRGHARRVAHPRDGRSYLLTLTASGLAAHRAANRQFETAYQAFLVALGSGEARTQARLTRLRGAVERTRTVRA